MKRHGFTTDKEWKALQAISPAEYSRLNATKTQREIAQKLMDVNKK